MITPRRPAAVAALAALGVLAGLALSQVPAPPPPDEYDAAVFYDNAYSADTVVELRESIRKLGLDFDPDETGSLRAKRKYVALTGTVKPTDARRLLNERRVRSVLLKAPGLPAAADQRVGVVLDIIGGFPLVRQRAFADALRPVLQAEGFAEQAGAGYDNRGHTRLVGTLPVGSLDNFAVNVRERLAASGPNFLPMPPGTPQIADGGWPVRVVTATDEPQPAEFMPPAPAAKELRRLSPELRDLAADDAAKATPVRMEVVLARAPGAKDLSFERAVRDISIDGEREGLPPLYVEYRLGQLVSLLGPPADAPRLLALPDVLSVRVARPAVSGVRVGPAAGEPDTLRADVVKRLAALGREGAGIRVAVVSDDFRGYEAFLGKGLPERVRYADLTPERSNSLLPDPEPKGPGNVGPGVYQALAVSRAAPKADLTLVRVGADSPYHLAVLLLSAANRPVLLPNVERLRIELRQEQTDLQNRRQELLARRRELLARFDADEDKEEWERLKEQTAAQDRAEADYQARLRRFLRLEEDLLGLRDVRVVSCGLNWPDGYAADGSSALDLLLGETNLRGVLWFQAAGDIRGQSWVGRLEDADRNGILEFAPFTAPLPAERWSPELNFVGWRPYDGAAGLDVPAGARVRVSVQWREAQDPRLKTPPETYYPLPVFNLGLRVLRQLDPAGAKTPADRLEVVGLANGFPRQLDNRPNSAAYEQVVEFTAAEGGRFAVQLLDLPPDGGDGPRPPRRPPLEMGDRDLPSFRPSDEPALGQTDAFFELRPRLTVQVIDGPTREVGRPVWADFATREGGLASPATARGAFTVGAVDGEGRLRSSSAVGPPWDVELLVKPELLAFDGLPLGGETVYGTGVSAGFAAGVAADALNVYLSPDAVRNVWLRRVCGSVDLRERVVPPLVPLPPDRPPTAPNAPPPQ